MSREWETDSEDEGVSSEIESVASLAAESSGEEEDEEFCSVWGGSSDSDDDSSDSDAGSDADAASEGTHSDTEIAEEEFLGQLIEMYMTSELSAMNFCILCWHASRAGVSGGPTQRYAMAPGKRVRRHQRN